MYQWLISESEKESIARESGVMSSGDIMFANVGRIAVNMSMITARASISRITG